MFNKIIIVTLILHISVTKVLALSSQKCPPVNYPEDVLFSHESDCTKFYKCDRGVKVLQQCPPGLHFNPKENYCDWPENVDCKNAGTEEPPNNTTCPPNNLPTDVLFPHESNCSKFYKCDFGQKIEQECPENLYFNPDAGYCDWPRNVDCKNANEEENRFDGPMCKFSDILLPHERECHKFYLCYNLEKVLMKCQQGLVFNYKTNRCDWPQNTDCNTAVLKW